MRLIARLPSTPSRSVGAPLDAAAAPSRGRTKRSAGAQRPRWPNRSRRLQPLRTSDASKSAEARRARDRRAEPGDDDRLEDGCDADEPKAHEDRQARRPRRRRRAVEILDPLAAPTHTLPGIGPAFAEKLAEKGLETVEDLLWCLPRRYDDVRDAQAARRRSSRWPRAARDVRARTGSTSSRMVFARGRRWAEVGSPSAARSIRASTAAFGRRRERVVRWFNVWAGIEKRMPAGALVTLSGVVKKRGGRLELANPDILAIDMSTDRSCALDGEGGRSRCRRSSRAIPTSPACRRRGCASRVRRRAARRRDTPTTACRQRRGGGEAAVARRDAVAAARAADRYLRRRARGAQSRR